MVPASTGGGLGGWRDRDLLLGKSGPSLPPWAVELPHKVVNTINGAADRAALFFGRSGRPWPASQLSLAWSPPSAQGRRKMIGIPGQRSLI
jgi:hypothetical protein